MPYIDGRKVWYPTIFWMMRNAVACMWGLRMVKKRHDVVAWAIGAVILIVLPALYFGVLQYRFDGAFSPIDEATHIGYAWSASHGHIPVKGETIPQEILNEWACAGQGNVETMPACGTEAPASEFPTEGEQYNFIHPPVYYFVTGMFARVMAHFLPFTFSQSARIGQILWMIVGMVLTYAALRRWNISRLYCYATVALVPFIPMFMNTGTAVNNDAPGLACGAVLLWLVHRLFVEHRFDWVPAVSAMVFCLMKGTFGFGFLGLMGVLGIMSLYWLCNKNFERGRRALLCALATVAVVGICIQGWSVFQNHRGDPAWQNPNIGTNSKIVEGNPLGEFMHLMLSGLDLSRIPGTLRGLSDFQAYNVWQLLLQAVLLGALGYLYFQRSEKTGVNALLACTAFSLLTYPMLVQIREYLFSRAMFSEDISVRYGMCLVPLVLACWAIALENRNSRILACAIPVIGSIVCLTSAVMATGLW